MLKDNDWHTFTIQEFWEISDSPKFLNIYDKQLSTLQFTSLSESISSMEVNLCVEIYSAVDLNWEVDSLNSTRNMVMYFVTDEEDTFFTKYATLTRMIVYRVLSCKTCIKKNLFQCYLHFTLPNAPTIQYFKSFKHNSINVHIPKYLSMPMTDSLQTKK